ncbi:MAG: MFS transporter [Anaerolineales bacterium]|nr:MFS transporter [Anaerolineales bacterium]
MKNQEKIRWIILYYTIFIYVGMSGAIIGPSLFKLIEQTNSSIGLLSYIFPARAISYLVGSWLAGLLFDKFRGHRLLILILPVMGLSLGLIPFLARPVTLIFVAMIMALATGLVDVGVNTLLFRVPDIKIAPVMNGLHFFFGVGSFFAPLILSITLKATQGIQWGFLGLALFVLVILVQFIQLKEPKSTPVDRTEQESESSVASINRPLLIWVVALFFIAFVGVEVGYGDWISTFAIRSGLTSETAAILLTSTYWGAFTLSRLFSIPLAAKLKLKTILIADVVGMFAGLGLVFLFPGKIDLLWVGTIILGFSVASLFPTMLTYVESMLPMTGKTTSIFFVSGSIGSIILPWVIGRTVESIGPIVIIRILFMSTVLAGVIFLVLLQISKKHPRQSARV